MQRANERWRWRLPDGELRNRTLRTVLAVRQGTRRVPFWRSWDWRNVYNGFGTDATCSQVVINRNGIVFVSVPEVVLPGRKVVEGGSGGGINPRRLGQRFSAALV
jgi:hypothetical protein